MDFRFWSKFKIVEVDGSSMTPNINPNWKMLFKKLDIEKINRHEVILYHFNEKLMIKRIIGLPNEYVEIKEGAVFINETQLIEEYIEIPRISEHISKWQLAENEYIILGDNSYDSLDSRKIGPIVLPQKIYLCQRRLWPLRLK
ncbi:MAG: signal peptidase I [Candidatus Heimdallarchaeota archaeon]|nr:signal peptidase I [Candidatus Heimdallarchaeota archaeon]